MSDYKNNADKPELHLHADPEVREIESLLDQLGQADRDAMPRDAARRVLAAVSGVIAPEPISIDRGQPGPTRSLPERARSWGVAAAAVLAVGTTLVIVGTRPWAGAPAPSPTPGAPGTLANQGETPGGGEVPGGSWNLASFEQDLDAYLTLDGVDDGQLAEAVTDWEIWAQTIDSDLDASLYSYQYETTDEDGAL